MSFIPKPNSGYLWLNDRKTEDSHPDWRGESVIDKKLLMDLIAKGDDPVKISVSAWNSLTKSGQQYFYLKYSEPFIPQKRAEPEPTPQQQIEPEDDEDVPF